MDEKALVEAAQNGDERAFATLATNCRIRAWNVCLRVCGNHHDAEDALQSALALAWKNLHKFNGKSSFATWFYRIATNASLQLVRTRKQTASIDDDTFGYEIELEDFRSEFTESVEKQDYLARALETLSDDAREALVLWSIADMKVADIAIHQGSSLSATKVRLHRAKKQLRAVLS